MSDFKQFTVAELVSSGVLETPMDGNHGELHPKTADFVDCGIPFIVASDVDGGRIRLDSCKFISRETADSLRKGRAYESDVLLSHKATIGRTAIVPRIDYEYLMLTPQVTYYRVRDKSILDSRYLKYYFDTNRFQRILGEWAGSGSTRAYLGITAQLSLPIRYPPLEAQKHVADALSVLDAKIELNNRINSELEALAKEIYDYWFVQFDFPDANGRPYKASGGKLIYNATVKREIPADWKVGDLSEIANITMGQSPAGSSYNKEGRGVVFFQGSTDFGLRSPEVRMYTTSPSRMAREGDILISVRAPVGALNHADRICCIGRGLAALNSKSGFDGYLYQVMTGLKQVFDRRSAEGTTFGSINKDDLFGLKVLIPDAHVLQKHAAICTSWAQMSALKVKENRELIQLRDWLLPLLMNGQVQVT